MVMKFQVIYSFVVRNELFFSTWIFGEKGDSPTATDGPRLRGSIISASVGGDRTRTTRVQVQHALSPQARGSELTTLL